MGSRGVERPTFRKKREISLFTYIHTYIHTFIEAPFTGLFSHNILKLQDKTKEFQNGNKLCKQGSPTEQQMHGKFQVNLMEIRGVCT